MQKFIRRHVQTVVQQIVLTIQLAMKNELLNHAGAAAFFCLLSIIPVILLLVFIFDVYYLQYFPDAPAHLFSFLKRLDSNFDYDILSKIGLLQMDASGLGLFGLINILWAGRWILISIQRGLGIIFHASKVRTPLVMNLLALAVLLGFLFLIVAWTLLSMWLEYVLPLIADTIVGRQLSLPILPLIRNLSMLVITFFCIFVTYRFLPAIRPSTVKSLKSAGYCALTILFIHWLFFRFVAVSQYSAIYGALASLVLTALWIHFSFVAFFFFAQYTYVSENLDILLMGRMYRYKHLEDPNHKKWGRSLFEQPERILSRYCRQYVADEIIFSQMDTSTEIYYIMAGQVGIYRSTETGTMKIGQLGQDELFGEMAYLLGEHRTATAVAETNSFLLVLQPDVFEELIKSNPNISRDLIGLLSRRIREAHFSTVV